jgi:CPA1 family monovalent cation:H+ antiporter
VAVVARTLMPGMPWAPAIALGAVVAPPDAAAATAVLRHLRPPHRILTILEGESLLNDASALLIYRLAVGAVAAEGFSIGSGCANLPCSRSRQRGCGPALGWLVLRLTTVCGRADGHHSSVRQHVRGLDRGRPDWSFWCAHHGVLRHDRRADVARAHARADTHTVLRVWETVVFMLNVLAFVFIGLQIRPILESLDPTARGRYFAIAGAVLLTVIVVRIAWHMSFNAVIRWRERRFGFHPPRPMLRPSVGSGLVISWAGMRGIVTLAAALALPAAFPFRDLIVLTAFSVVLGTLALQGLTLGPLLRALDLRDDDPVGHEVGAARERALRAGLAAFAHDRSPVAEQCGRSSWRHLGSVEANPDGGDAARRSAHNDIHRRALQAARQAVLAMRASDEIGDGAFHQIEEELDWIEMAGGGKEEEPSL